MSVPSHSGSRDVLTSRYPYALTSRFTGPFAYNMAEEPKETPKEAPKETPKEQPKETPSETPKEQPKNSAEDRIKEVLAKNKELETKLAEKEAAEKKRSEEELAKKGEHEKLAAQYAEERDKAINDSKSATEQAKAYEEVALAQITQSVEGIQDEEKRKSVKSAIDGLPTLEQYKRLPEILKLVGHSANGFGAPNPGSNGPPAGSVEQKKARLVELSQKRDRTPAEDRELSKLTSESMSWKKE